LSIYNVSADQAAEDRRTRRHNPANPPTTGPRCPQCSRICASEFGLRSHLDTESCLTSTSATLLAAQTSSSNSTDYCKQASKQLLIPPKDTCCTVADNDCRCHIFIRLSLSDFRDSLTISIGHSYSTPGLLVWLNDSYRHENGVYPFRDDRSHLTTLASVPGPLSRHV